MTAQDQIITAVISAISGGALVKILERIVDGLLGAQKTNREWESLRRKELDEERKTLKDELRLLEEEVEEWRDKYYKLLETNLQLMADNRQAVENGKYLTLRIREFQARLTESETPIEEPIPEEDIHSD